MLNVFGLSLHFFHTTLSVGWAIALHRKFNSGAAKKLPVKGFKKPACHCWYTLNKPDSFCDTDCLKLRIR